MLKTAERAKIDPFIVMNVMQAAAQRAITHGDDLHLEVGQPGFGAPEAARRAVAEAMEGSALGYTVAYGNPALRTRIAQMYQQTHGVTIAPERIAITAGSSAGFILSFLAAFEAGDRVAMALPGYPAYRNTLSALGLEVVPLLTDIEDGFQPTVAALEAAIAEGGPLEGLVIASPSNPCGTIIPPEQLRELQAFCAANGIRIISDEIYHGLSYGPATATMAGIDPDAVIVNSFSKYYCMTGWRIGWLVVPEALVQPVEHLMQNLFICAPHVAQVAALAGMDAGEELDLHMVDYAQNRNILLGMLSDAGVTRVAPADGAFYVYADFSDWTNDSLSFAGRILEETGVAVTPGIDFDPVRGHRFLRFSFCERTAVIAEAAERLGTWLKADR